MLSGRSQLDRQLACALKLAATKCPDKMVQMAQIVVITMIIRIVNIWPDVHHCSFGLFWAELAQLNLSISLTSLVFSLTTCKPGSSLEMMGLTVTPRYGCLAVWQRVDKAFSTRIVRVLFHRLRRCRVGMDGQRRLVAGKVGAEQLSRIA